MRNDKTRRLALMGLLISLGLIAGYIEFLIPIPLGIPGVKPINWKAVKRPKY